MARPTKYSQERVDAIIAALEVGCSVERAREAAGIGKDAYAHWKRTKPEFAEAIKKAESGFVHRALAQILKIGLEQKQWTALAWILERRLPAEFGKRLEVNEHKPQLNDKERLQKFQQIFGMQANVVPIAAPEEPERKIEVKAA